MALVRNDKSTVLDIVPCCLLLFSPFSSAVASGGTRKLPEELLEFYWFLEGL